MSLAKLTSISTKTLSLLLERQRLQNLPSFTASNPLDDQSSGNSLHFAQIKKNLEQLRNGIMTMETKEGRSEASGLLRNQYERMRGMLGRDAEGIPSIQEPSPSPSPSPPASSMPSVGLSSSRGVSKHDAAQLFSSSSHSREDSTPPFAPYTDNPSDSLNGNSRSGGQEGAAHSEEDTGILLQTQRFLMEEQDQRLDQLSHSVTRQHHISLQINDELDVHAGLLQELDDDLENTSGRLSNARRRMDKLSKVLRENSSVAIIGALIFVLLILIIVLKT